MNYRLSFILKKPVQWFIYFKIVNGSVYEPLMLLIKEN